MRMPWHKPAAPALVVSASTPPSTPTADPELDELEELQKSITVEQAKLAKMEAEGRELGNHLGEISQLACALKVRCSEHDKAAADQLDVLEREQRAITRRYEGLTLRITTLQAALAPLVRHASELAAARDAKRQDDVVKRFGAEKDKLIEEILSNWTRSCAAAYDLMVMLDGGMGGQVLLDAEHRRQLFAMNTIVGERLLRAALAHVNDRHQFQFARSEVFQHLKIIPAKRKEIARAAG